MTELTLPTYADVEAAAARLAGHAHRTPVLRSRTADAALQATLYFKCENLQRMGAFKFRGAFNALSRFSAEQRRAGVLAFSSGNHAQAITGQGTAAKELFDEVGPLDVLLVCLGGGGLLAGSALAARALSPDCRVYGVEPEAGNDGQQSLRRGEVVHIAPPRTIADGAQTQHLGQLTFGIIRRDVSDILTVSDAQLVESMRFYAERMKLVVEPTGALSLAGAHHGGLALKGLRVGVIISGGNVDLPRYAQLLSQSV